MFVIRPIPHHFLLWLLLMPVFLLELHALDTFTDTIALQDSSRTKLIAATIIDHRQQIDGYEVRYQFRLPGDPNTYIRTGLLGQTAEWVKISIASWEQAKGRETINVVYLPENPWANQPLGLEGRPIENSFMGWLIFLLIDMVWFAESFFIVRNFFAAQTALERRHVESFRFWRTSRRPTVFDRAYQ